MKDLQFSLYEVFGYLLPGAVLGGGLAVIFWAGFFPQSVIDIDTKSTEVWAGFLALAYVTGHVAQGMGNAVARRFGAPEDHIVRAVLPAPIIEACKSKIRVLTGADVDGLSPRWLYRVCDDAVLRSGKLGEREVYVYREGFYRGASVGMAVVAVGLLAMTVRLLSEPGTGAGPPFLAIPAVWLIPVAAATGGWAVTERIRRQRIALALAVVAVCLVAAALYCLSVGNWAATVRVGVLKFTPARLSYLALLAGVGTWFLWHRFWRFAEYRVTQAFLGFLTLSGEVQPDAPKSEE